MKHGKALVAIVVLAAVAVFLAAQLLDSIPSHTARPCESYADTSISGVPARCLAYWTVQR